MAEHHAAAEREGKPSSETSDNSGTGLTAGFQTFEQPEMDHRSRVFDIVLQSPSVPTSVTPFGLTSPSTPSISSPMTSSSDTVFGANCVSCYGDERRMLAEIGRRFYNRRLLSDIRLRVGERVYRGHKLFLARASDVFERMLCSTEWNEAVKQVNFAVNR
jgi:BTB/POZ domain